MPLFEVLESKLIYRDPNNCWYLLAMISLNTGEIYYVLTHNSNEREQKVFMSQYAAEDFQEFLQNWPGQVTSDDPQVSPQQSTGNFYVYAFVVIFKY